MRERERNEGGEYERKEIGGGEEGWRVQWKGGGGWVAKVDTNFINFSIQNKVLYFFFLKQ